MRPLLLIHSARHLSRRSIYRFFRSTGEAGVDVCLLALADTLATYGPGLPDQTWIDQLEVTRTLLEAWWEQQDEVITPARYLSGDDLMEELELKPGPLIGQILNAIQEEQASGDIRSYTKALEFARNYIHEQRQGIHDDNPLNQATDQG